MKAIWSHPFPAIWYNPRATYPYIFRGPNMKERMFYKYDEEPWVSVVHHVQEWGLDIDKIAKFDGRPPCIFCGKMFEEHGGELCGQSCRPKCIVQDCERDTCVQAVVNGYLPSCLKHFHEDRIARRAQL